MTEDPVDLDERRGAVAQQETEERRQYLQKFQADMEGLRGQQGEFENLLCAAPAETWREVAAKAQYLIQLFAITPEAQDPRRRDLIAQTLDDLTRLCERSKEH